MTGRPSLPHLLFVCTANRHRSRTAEDLYRLDPRYEVMSAGTDVDWGDPSERPVTEELVAWADQIFVMAHYHREVLTARFPGCERKITVLDIPDVFLRGDPELIALLHKRLIEHL